MRPSKILVTPRSLTQAGLAARPELEPLRQRGYELISGPAGQLPGEDELLALVPGCAGWLAGVERITERVLAAARDLRVISRNGTGVDAIDLAAAGRAGVIVRSAPGANAQGVAELTVSLVLGALRHIPWTAAAVRAGGWHREYGLELADCVIGLIGLGAVGRRVGELFTALGVPVLACDPVARPAGIRLTSLDELLAASTVVSLHCPPLPGGVPLIDAAALAAMNQGAVLVNTARDTLVDDDAVLAALTSGRLAAYAVDAFATEPPELSPLLAHERVIATPHLGGYTRASVRRATMAALDNLLAVLDAV